MPTFPFAPIWLLSALLIVFNSFGWSGGKINSDLDGHLQFVSYSYNQSSLHSAASPTVTVAINLPVIENDGPDSSPMPLDSYPAPEPITEVPPGTPTPTPIPVQTGSANVPIVLGALAIIIVVLLAWFFVGYLPARKKNEPF